MCSRFLILSIMHNNFEFHEFRRIQKIWNLLSKNLCIITDKQGVYWWNRVSRAFCTTNHEIPYIEICVIRIQTFEITRISKTRRVNCTYQKIRLYRFHFHSRAALCWYQQSFRWKYREKTRSGFEKSKMRDPRISKFHYCENTKGKSARWNRHHYVWKLTDRRFCAFLSRREQPNPTVTMSGFVLQPLWMRIFVQYKIL